MCGHPTALQRSKPLRPQRPALLGQAPPHVLVPVVKRLVGSDTQPKYAARYCAVQGPIPGIAMNGTGGHALCRSEGRTDDRAAEAVEGISDGVSAAALIQIGGVSGLVETRHITVDVGAGAGGQSDES